MASGDTILEFRPQDNEPPASNYAKITVVNGHPVLAFNDTTAQAAVFSAALPRNYAGGGLTCYVTHCADTATTGTIGWTIEFETSSGQVLGTDGFASAQTVTAATVAGVARTPTITNVAVSNGANMDSIAVGLSFRLRLTRDVANDTAVGDALFMVLELKET